MAHQSHARDVSRPRFRESGSSKVVRSTQEPNRTALSHFSLFSLDVTAVREERNSSSDEDNLFADELLADEARRPGTSRN